MSTEIKTKHIGRNISRIRELRGIKQEVLAKAIGVTQQSVSNMEASETIEEEKLVEVAKALGVSVEAIKNFSEEGVINYFNYIHDNDFNNIVVGNSCTGFSPNYTYNPLDKLVEAYEESKRLYERLLDEKNEKISYLEKLVNK
ncbi:helix-turn-helix domain-containing protein [Flavobacterium aestivum]|uniref:helix-turn-helix domain-containing protein n=1 Tax=Flavobacterium aestivum TaxID=3003257 RepID=UPI00228613BD|nr:helix-turn-helix transcriptional regulator [Flavobacterium aestivum]